MNKRERISAIHASDAFGILVESGCAGVLSHSLQSVEGASKTVYMSETPYSKEYQHQVYGNAGLRSIGKETAGKFASRWIRECLLNMHGGVNFIYASTFQIAELNSGKSTHGWIAYIDLKAKTRKIFHVSMKTMPREDVLDLIMDIGLDILEGKVPKYADIMEESMITHSNVGTFRFEETRDLTPELINDLDGRIEFEETNYICINTKKKTVRLEEILRDKKKILIYKGSFNPPHNVHLKFAEMAEMLHGEKPIFSISTDTFEKGHIDGEAVLSRANAINELGYDVIIVKDAFFSTLYRHLDEKIPADPTKIVFLLGSDTFNRLITSSHTKPADFAESFPNAKFMVMIRPGFPLIPEAGEFIWHMQIIDEKESSEISSTHIRKLMSENNMDEIRELVPDAIYKLIKDK